MAVDAKQIHEALLSAFQSRTALQKMVSYRLHQNLNVISDAGNLDTDVFILVQKYEELGQLNELIQAAYLDNPDNPSLSEVANQVLGKLPPAPSFVKMLVDTVGLQIDLRRVSLRQKMNLALCASAILLVVAWGAIMVDVKLLWALPTAIGIFATSSAVEAFFKKQFVRRFVELLWNALDRPLATLVCSLALGISAIGSLFIGSIEYLPEGMAQDTPLLWLGPPEVLADVSRDPLMPESPKLIYAPPHGHGYHIHAVGRQPLELVAVPWRRRRVLFSDLKPLPFVLVIPHNQIAASINASDGWRFEAAGPNGTTHAVKNYAGQPVWLGGDGESQPILPTAPGRGTISFKRNGGMASWPEPTLPLLPNMKVKVRISGPSEEFSDTIEVHTPSSSQDDVTSHLLVRP